MSKWSDIMIFNFDSQKFLLQGKKRKFSRATVFRTVSIGDRFFSYSTAHNITEEHMKNAGLWEQHQ